MHWPSRKSSEPAAAAEAPPPSASKFSAPPSSEVSAAAAAPPMPAKTSYDSMDFSKYASSVYESDGLADAQQARQERSYYDGGNQWVTHPRARQCLNNITMGAKFGASVGGCFGLLTGTVVAVTQRNPFFLPVSVIVGATSFGFFLGCGMIIRCEEEGQAKRAALVAASVAAPERERRSPAALPQLAGEAPRLLPATMLLRRPAAGVVATLAADVE
eukprot:TRINITY_DN20489_c0_g1_i1.p2 TRINITY_DN20489_c0_g1~~TRINITY_DN20489_c0_g1_i1.p2  ORF type:complete len:216 (-),score=64.45 TRINITY_DN20489_c0_g1_i1:58-705(-)